MGLMTLKEFLKTFCPSMTKICVICWDEMLGDRVVYRGRVDTLLNMEFSDESFEKALRSPVEHISNGTNRFLDIYCDDATEPLRASEVYGAIERLTTIREVK